MCVVFVASLRLRLLFALPALPARVRALCVCVADVFSVKFYIQMY